MLINMVRFIFFEFGLLKRDLLETIRLFIRIYFLFNYL